MTISITIELSEEGFQRLKAAAFHVGKLQLDFVQESLQEHIEDVEDTISAEAALSKIRSGKMKTSPLEDVMRKLGLEN